jgi:hypothetical protein
MAIAADLPFRRFAFAGGDAALPFVARRPALPAMAAGNALPRATAAAPFPAPPPFPGPARAMVLPPSSAKKEQVQSRRA